MGGFDHDSWRAFKAERRRAPARGVIDGDLIEKFLDLPREKMEEVLAGKTPLTRIQDGATVEVSAEDLVREVEDLMRLH